jgi:hypothetical protein
LGEIRLHNDANVKEALNIVLQKKLVLWLPMP